MTISHSAPRPADPAADALAAAHQLGLAPPWVSPRFAWASALLLRLGLAAAFLSAVADRFGLWGPPGTGNVAWGEWGRFVAYTGAINPWAPAWMVPALAWSATALETALGVGLLAGVWTRALAFASGMLLLAFALAMTFSGRGVEAVLSYSVYTAAGGALLLAAAPAVPYGALARGGQRARTP